MVQSSNGINLFTKNYLVNNPKANAFIVQGLHEHCLRYAHVAATLNKLGISVYTFDLRGHGQSSGTKVNVKSIDEYRDDVLAVVQTIPNNLPLFIIGHSMGGLVVTDFLLSAKREQITGAILSGPALEIGEGLSPILIKLAGIIGSIAPNLGTQKLDINFLTRDQAEVEKASKDPLIYMGGTKAGLGKAVISRINELKPKFKNFDYPVLIMHGGADKLTNINGSKELYKNAKSADKTIKIWDGAYHEIFNEINKDEVLSFMGSWIEKRL
jgi:acylglycerol lipase